MTRKNFRNQGERRSVRYLRQTHHTTVRPVIDKDQLAEVGVRGDEDSVFAQGPFENGVVPRVRCDRSGFDYIVALGAQPFCHYSPSAPIDQEPQGAIGLM